VGDTVAHVIKPSLKSAHSVCSRKHERGDFPRHW